MINRSADVCLDQCMPACVDMEREVIPLANKSAGALCFWIVCWCMHAYGARMHGPVEVSLGFFQVVRVLLARYVRGVGTRMCSRVRGNAPTPLLFVDHRLNSRRAKLQRRYGRVSVRVCNDLDLHILQGWVKNTLRPTARYRSISKIV